MAKRKTVSGTESSWFKTYNHYLAGQKKRQKIQKYLPDTLAKSLMSLLGLDRVSSLRKAIENELLTNPAVCKNGKIYIRDLILPTPVNDVDSRPICEAIRDIIYPYALEPFLSPEQIISQTLYGEGPYEYSNVTLDKGDIVIDAGACAGEFAALASIRGAQRIYAFEPIPNIIETYLSKTAEFNTNIEICKYALSDYTGELKLDVMGLDGSSAYMDNEKSTATVQAKVITLDEFVEQSHIPHVDFIKADIEGAERYMLKGAVRVLKEFAPKLAICTYHLPDDPQVLRKIITQANPDYIIEERWKKMYAYVPGSRKQEG